MEHSRPSIYDLKSLKKLKIDPAQMGYVVLEFPQTPFKNIEEHMLYFSQDPRLKDVQGQNEKLHVTLKYGLIKKDQKQFEESVQEVLTGWEPEDIHVSHFNSFSSQIEGEDYNCIYADVSGNACLYQAHSRLSMLPHIDTQRDYIAHVTLAYVKSEFTAQIISELNERLSNRNLWLTGGQLSYGDK